MISERVMERFLDLVRISSPSKNERECADYIKKVLEELGIEHYEDNVGEKIGGNTGNIIAYLKGKKNKTYLFSAHMDTVRPCDNITPIIDNGVIKSEGENILGGDDKIGVVAILELLRILKKKGNNEHPSIVAVFTVAEESGLLGSKGIDLSNFNIDCGFVLDSGGAPGKVVTKAPYVARGDIVIYGKGAHSGVAPEKGINALVVTSDIVMNMKLGRIDDETTSNIGYISGGEATNIVLPKITMRYEIRSLSEDKLKNLIVETRGVLSEISQKYGARYEDTIKLEYTGFKVESCNLAVKLVEESCKKLGIDFNITSSGGGSDTNIYNSMGIKAINLGVGMSEAHTTSEFVRIDDIEKIIKIIVEIVKG